MKRAKMVLNCILCGKHFWEIVSVRRCIKGKILYNKSVVSCRKKAAITWDWTFNKVVLLCKRVQFRKVFWNGGFQIFGVVKMEMAHWLSPNRHGKPRDMEVIFIIWESKNVPQVYFIFQGFCNNLLNFLIIGWKPSREN